MTHLRRSLVVPSAVVALAAALSTAPAVASPPRTNDANSLLRQGVVTTDTETPALYDDEEGGNASGDDPAIWVHPTDSTRSVVVVTAKEGGLRVYDLGARELQSVEATPAPGEGTVDGRFNNVDIARGVPLAGERVDVAVVSDRYNDQVRFYAIDPAGAGTAEPLREVTAPGLPWLFSESRDEVDEAHTAYGLTVWQPEGGAAHAVVTQEGATTLATVRIEEVAPGLLGYRDVDTTVMPSSFDLPDGTTWVPCEEPGAGPHLEGLAVDQESAVLYAAQEDVGLWRLPLPFGSGEPVLVDRVRDFGVADVWDEESEECAQAGPDRGLGGQLLTADAEGVDVWSGPGGTGWVVVSSQGDSTFAVYRLHGRNLPVGSFSIDGVGGADDIDGSDGLALTTQPVGRFTEGLFVSHDEPETPDDGRDATNFSYVSLGDIARSLGLPAR